MMKIFRAGLLLQCGHIVNQNLVADKLVWQISSNRVALKSKKSKSSNDVQLRPNQGTLNPIIESPYFGLSKMYECWRIRLILEGYKLKIFGLGKMDGMLAHSSRNSKAKNPENRSWQDGRMLPHSSRMLKG